MLKNILLVEDDEAIAQTLIFSLQREGWQVHWCALGQQALDYLAQQTVDFIILDVGLPDINGFDLCRQIRQQQQTPLL
ncbi:MAG: response regulator, partial [Pseudomonadales bacterium]|nr:response regulator [Pseudomonadales bacterium]